MTPRLPAHLDLDTHLDSPTHSTTRSAQPWFSASPSAPASRTRPSRTASASSRPPVHSHPPLSRAIVEHSGSLGACAGLAGMGSVQEDRTSTQAAAQTLRTGALAVLAGRAETRLRRSRSARLVSWERRTRHGRIHGRSKRQKRVSGVRRVVRVVRTKWSTRLRWVKETARLTVWFVRAFCRWQAPLPHGQEGRSRPQVR